MMEPQTLLQNMEPVKAVSILAKEYGPNRKELAEMLLGAEISERKKDSIRNIGIYYHRYTPGGVQRVISLLIPLYLEAGYRVILFTDELEQGEYELPEQVKRVVLPSALLLSYDRYEERAVLIRKSLEEYRVDVMLYQGAESRFLLYDMLLVKRLGIPFCVGVHGLFSAELLRCNRHITEKRITFQMADRILVLSQMEKNFWESLGVSAVYMPNPIQNLPFKKEAGKYILWLGRLEEMEKQPTHCVRIMKKVVEACPEARMKIVGQEVTKGVTKALKKKIRKAGLEEHVELCGGTENVEPYYKDARIFLCTSSCEAFSMTIVESKGYGIPLVTYDMPYLEVLKSRQGCICVPQDDIEAAANAIIQLLRDDELHQTLKEQARKSYETLQEFDLKEAWECFLKSLAEGEPKRTEETFRREDVGMLLTTLLEHYDKGCRKNGEEAEYALLKKLWKFGRLYRFWKENGFRKTKDIIVRKIGDTHDKD